eukprot:148410-Amphidinium_carterae.1
MLSVCVTCVCGPCAMYAPEAAVGAHMQLLEGWLCAQSEQTCRDIIEHYALGGDGGITRKYVRSIAHDTCVTCKGYTKCNL